MMLIREIRLKIEITYTLAYKVLEDFLNPLLSNIKPIKDIKKTISNTLLAILGIFGIPD